MTKPQIKARRVSGGASQAAGTTTTSREEAKNRAKNAKKGKAMERDPDNSCTLYQPAPVVLEADCLTDGHYLCEGCKYNRHRLNGVLGEVPDTSMRGMRVIALNSLTPET